MSEQILHVAAKLVEVLDETVDEKLPEKIAGIIKLHAKIAVGSALIPVPGADVAAAAANIWTMYVRINKELNLPFKENIIKSVASGVAINLGTAVAGALVAGTMLKIIPGFGSVAGAAVMGATVYGVTIASGIFYMKALTKLIKKKSVDDISENDLKDATKNEIKEKGALKDILKTAKKEFEKEKE